MTRTFITAFRLTLLLLLWPGADAEAICLFDSDCASTQFCSLFECRARGSSRDSCSGIGQGTCRAGLVCDVLGECRHSPPQAGELCARLDPNSCSGGAGGSLACSAAGRCVARGAALASCTGLGQGTCQPGLACDALGECRHVPGEGGERCGAAVPCIASLGCSADVGGRCLARGGPGQSCSGVGQGSCEAGLVCNALPRVCRHELAGPGEGCSIVVPCRSDLACIDGTCAAPRKAGEGCLFSSDCQSGLDCRPCFTSGCWAPFQCFPQAGHELIPSDECLALYSPAVHGLAVNGVRATLSFGTGSSASAIAGTSAEVGTVYGQDGRYGCYLSLCVGATISGGVSSFASLGVFSSYEAFAGTDTVVVESVGLGAGGAFSFSTSQVFSQTVPPALVGTNDALSIGVGLAPPLSAGVYQCTTVVDTVKTLDPVGVPVVPLPGPAPAPDLKPTLVAAALPSARSVQAGHAATAFATVLNTGPVMAIGVGIAAPGFPGTLSYQTTDPATNTVTGVPNAPANIAPGKAQTYVVALAPAAPFGPAEVPLAFAGTNAAPAPSVAGLNTLLLVASDTPVPDVVALAATPSGDGIASIAAGSRSGAFAVATVNVGVGGAITVSADTGAQPLPVALAVCRTDPGSGQCEAPPAPTVTTQVPANATPTYSVFITVAEGVVVSLDPSANRVFVRFTDAGGIVRGSTSVAVRTEE